MHAAFFCTLALLVLAAAPDGFTGTSRVTGDDIVRELRAGHAVVLDGVRVDGPLYLAGGGAGGDTDVIRRVFKCRGCTFAGPVSAPDVTFERTVDLSGSTFEGDVDFTGATFQAPVLFGAGGGEDGYPRTVRFEGRVVFSLAVFGEFASFGASAFKAEAAFRNTRFADTSFATVVFKDVAAFDGASFRGAAIFNNAAEFAKIVSFNEADFRNRTDFSTAVFDEGATFSSAQFANGASFLAAEFNAPAANVGEAARFDGAASAGDLDFTFATFESESKQPRVLLALGNLVCGGSLIFRGTTFTKTDWIAMERLKVRDLVLDVDVVSQINLEEDRQEILRSIEESAKSRGDIGDANDAHYALNVRRSAGYDPVWRALDYVFYRGAAGYLVRPFRPLIVLLVLATLLSLGRYLRRPRDATRDEAGSRRPLRRLVLRVGRWWSGFLMCVLDTLTLAGPRRGSAKGEPALGERLEIIVYRLLLVCALIGLANSNPTLREMVDTLM
jgi:Pentapeptide repeats (9 copies)